MTGDDIAIILKNIRICNDKIRVLEEEFGAESNDLEVYIGHHIYNSQIEELQLEIDKLKQSIKK